MSKLQVKLHLTFIYGHFTVHTGDMKRRPGNGLHQLGQPVAPSIPFPGWRFISPVCINQSFCPVCGRGRCLSSSPVLKYLLGNEKQEMRSYYASQQCLIILLTCFRAMTSAPIIPNSGWISKSYNFRCCYNKAPQGSPCVVGIGLTCASGTCNERFPWWKIFFWLPAALSEQSSLL